MIKNLIYGIAGSALIGLILSWFFDGYIPYLGGGAVLLFTVYYVFFQDNLRLVLTDDELIVDRFGRKNLVYVRDECSFASKIVRTVDSTLIPDSDCSLTITDADGKVKRINCSNLGGRRFRRFIDDLGLLEPQESVLEATKKEK